jgi:hypothetical protein
MAGLVPAIHVLTALQLRKDVDARDKRGHDGLIESALIPISPTHNTKQPTLRIPVEPGAGPPLSLFFRFPKGAERREGE